MDKCKVTFIKQPDILEILKEDREMTRRKLVDYDRLIAELEQLRAIAQRVEALERKGGE